MPVLLKKSGQKIQELRVFLLFEHSFSRHDVDRHGQLLRLFSPHFVIASQSLGDTAGLIINIAIYLLNGRILTNIIMV